MTHTLSRRATSATTTDARCAAWLAAPGRDGARPSTVACTLRGGPRSVLAGTRGARTARAENFLSPAHPLPRRATPAATTDARCAPWLAMHGRDGARPATIGCVARGGPRSVVAGTRDAQLDRAEDFFSTASRTFPSIGNGNADFFQALEKTTAAVSNAWKTPCAPHLDCGFRLVGGSSCSRATLTKPTTHSRGSRNSRPQEQQRHTPVAMYSRFTRCVHTGWEMSDSSTPTLHHSLLISPPILLRTQHRDKVCVGRTHTSPRAEGGGR